MADIEKPDPTIYGGEDGMTTGIAKYNDKLVTIIDFEKILFDISPEVGFSPDDVSTLGSRTRSNKPILLAEDSPLLEKLIINSLEKAGYVNLICSSNGQEAWGILQNIKAGQGPIENRVAAVITDIEMPLMDGNKLLALIKEDDVLKKLPVIIFSSIITDEMRAQGIKLGAVASISKPEIANLVTVLDSHIL